MRFAKGYAVEMRKWDQVLSGIFCRCFSYCGCVGVGMGLEVVVMRL